MLRGQVPTLPLVFIGAVLSSCHPTTELNLLIVSGETVTVEAAILSVDRLLMEGCGGDEGEEVALAHTFDLSRPEAITLSRGRRCDLGLVSATSSSGVMVLRGLTPAGTTFRMRTNPPRASLGEGFLLDRDEAILVVEADQLVDAAALDTRAAEQEAADPTLEGESTPDVLLDLDRADALCQAAGKALGDALWIGTIEEAGRRYGARWPYLSADFEPEAELPHEAADPEEDASEGGQEDGGDGEEDSDPRDTAYADTWASPRWQSDPVRPSQGCSGGSDDSAGASGGAGGGCEGCSDKNSDKNDDSASDTGEDDDRDGCEACNRGDDTAGLAWPAYAGSLLGLLWLRRRPDRRPDRQRATKRPTRSGS